MMRLPLLICSLLAAAMPALAQTPTVEDLLAKNLESRGGAERLRAITTRRVAGYGHGAGADAARGAAAGGGAGAANAADADAGAREAPEPDAAGDEDAGPARRHSLRRTAGVGHQPDDRAIGAVGAGRAGRPDPDQAQFDGPLAYAKQRGDKMEVLGKEDDRGPPAWKLAITHGDKITTVYLDEKTALERKVSASVNQGGTQLLVESLISDYQPVDGIMVPRKVQTLVGGQTQATVSIEKIEFNVPIEDTEFKMPAAQ